MARSLATAALLLLLALAAPAAAFFEQVFEQMMGGQQAQALRWPQGVSDRIKKKYDFLKGTEWLWNGGHAVQLHRDGKFFHQKSQFCANGLCRWSANKNRVWVLMPQDEGGLVELLLPDGRELPENVYDEEKYEGLRMAGRQVHDGARAFAVFSRIFDTAEADLQKDLYGILGLTEDASDQEVKAAYRKLSKQYHPDKAGADKNAAKLFNDVRDAYEVLGTEEKKILYDTGGLEAVKNLEANKVPKGQPMKVEFGVALEQLYNGHTLNASYMRRVVCRGCSKKPHLEKCKACGRCPNEKRTVHQQVGNGMFIQREQEIPSSEKCKNENTALEVHVERGMNDGEEVIFPLKAEERPNIIPGDVIVVLKLDQKQGNSKTDVRFRRTKDDLHMDLTISLREALLGFKRSFRHLDGHVVKVGSQDVIKPGAVLKVHGEGMPHREDPETFGHLYVQIDVAFPKTLTVEQRTVLGEVLTPGGFREEL